MPHIHVEQRPRGSPLATILGIIILLLLGAAIWYFFFGPGRVFLPPGAPKGLLEPVAGLVGLVIGNALGIAHYVGIDRS